LINYLSLLQRWPLTLRILVIYLGHIEFDGDRIVRNVWSAFGNGCDPECTDENILDSLDSLSNDGHGHGTHVAGTIGGVHFNKLFCSMFSFFFYVSIYLFCLNRILSVLLPMQTSMESKALEMPVVEHGLIS